MALEEAPIASFLSYLVYLFHMLVLIDISGCFSKAALDSLTNTAGYLWSPEGMEVLRRRRGCLAAVAPGAALAAVFVIRRVGIGTSSLFMYNSYAKQTPSGLAAGARLDSFAGVRIPLCSSHGRLTACFYMAAGHSSGRKA